MVTSGAPSAAPQLQMRPQEPLLNDAVIQLLAGAGSGALTKTALSPLERIKILFQLQGMHGFHGENAKYRGILGSARTIWAEEGFLGFYKGNLANVVRIVPTYALKFTLNDQIRDFIRGPDQSVRDMGFGQMMTAGTIAGMIQFSVTYPLDTVRTRLSLADALTNGHRYRGILHCFSDTVAREGPRALYKGFGPALLSGSPYVGLQMTCYQMFQRLRPEDSPLPVKLWNLFAGACAGVVAQTITFPGDTLRRRMQSNGLAGQALKYRNSWEACKVIMRTEGWTAFYRGVGANTLRAVPGAAIQFAAYDGIKEMLSWA